MKKIVVITLNYNGDKDTNELLDSFLKVRKSNFEMEFVIIDNASKKPFKLDDKKYADLRPKVIRNSENLGFAGGNNVGFKYALDNSADYVLAINNDTLVEENFLQELVNLLEEREDAGIIVPKIYFEKGYEFHKDRYKKEDLGKVVWYAGGNFDWKNVYATHRGVDEVDIGQYSDVVETDFASGCAFLIKADVLRNVGLFDEKFFLYFEDSDLSLRVKKWGNKILFCPTSIIWHKNASSSGGSGSSLQDYFMTRNRMLFALKYASVRAKIAIFKESIKILSSGREWQKIGIRDFYLGRFGKGSYKA